jgi:hypothetical protein
MLVLLGIVLFLLGAGIFVGVAFLSYYAAKAEYRDPVCAICPENGEEVELRVDAAFAAHSRLEGHEQLKIVACSRWPERSECDQACTPEVPMLGDNRRRVKYAAGGLPVRYMRINNPVKMSRELYDKLMKQLEKQRTTRHIA